jgi:hypothetical protein
LGTKYYQVDRLPCEGGCPTTTWRAGDLIGERYDLLMASHAPPGRYQLIAGMYDLATMENLPWFDANGGLIGNHLVLGVLEVQ